METLTLNEKGQITIPAPLRKKLGIKAGSQLRLFAELDAKTLTLSPTGSLHDAFGILPKPKKALSIDEMNEAVEKSVAQDAINYERD